MLIGAQDDAPVGIAPRGRAFSFVAQPTPCDGMDCSQGFCLLNNAAIAAPPALLSFMSYRVLRPTDVERLGDALQHT